MKRIVYLTLFVMFIFVLGACATATAMPTIPPAATIMLAPTVTPYTYDWSGFQAHISEYMDPEWTSTTPEYPYIHEDGYIKGGLVIVSADTGQVFSPLNGNEDPYNNDKDPGPPDWGLPFAKTPEEVGTVVLVWANKHVDWTWADGGKAYGEDWCIKVVDLEARTVFDTSCLAHRDQPRTKYGPGDRYAAPPWYKLMSLLRALLAQPSLAPDEGEISQFATGATASSQYSKSSWSAMQATGAPDAAGCHNSSSAWSSLDSISKDWLLLTYDQPVTPTRIVIYQPYNPGAISLVEVLDEADNSITVYEADPTKISQCPYVLEIDVKDVNTPVHSIRITKDQSINNGWNMIDAVQLLGKPR